ncbi:hypothetical protein OE647_13705 [Defluviimonas sp. WL0075]|uniref:Transposase n=1 Tax=Albidovulum sediminicola TaxID=2984331 RepID=A0ABT2Z3P1_9RHOB|nr:hypothetical protein [Defluviimonas sp. WL0075]
MAKSIERWCALRQVVAQLQRFEAKLGTASRDRDYRRNLAERRFISIFATNPRLA